MISKAYAKQFSALLSTLCLCRLWFPLAAFSGYGMSVIITAEKNKQFSNVLA
jgi:hypothetical protein